MKVKTELAFYFKRDRLRKLMNQNPSIHLNETSLFHFLLEFICCLCFGICILELEL
jgi:hypothetical protein